jgi:hypothetical protein
VSDTTMLSKEQQIVTKVNLTRLTCYWGMERKKVKKMDTDSRHKTNEEVTVNFGKAGVLCGIVCGVKYSINPVHKVYYDIQVFPFNDHDKDFSTVLKDVDSYFIEKIDDRFNGKSGVGVNDSKN